MQQARSCGHPASSGPLQQVVSLRAPRGSLRLFSRGSRARAREVLCGRFSSLPPRTLRAQVRRRHCSPGNPRLRPSPAAGQVWYSRSRVIVAEARCESSAACRAVRPPRPWSEAGRHALGLANRRTGSPFKPLRFDYPSVTGRNITERYRNLRRASPLRLLRAVFSNRDGLHEGANSACRTRRDRRRHARRRRSHEVIVDLGLSVARRLMRSPPAPGSHSRERGSNSRRFRGGPRTRKGRGGIKRPVFLPSTLNPPRSGAAPALFACWPRPFHH